MNILIDPSRKLFEYSNMIYGHFIEHFHRQIYGGVFDPENSLSDKDGFRTDVIEAMKAINVPILRWPGGCFVSSYHWKDGVGPDRKPFFDKAWRVEDPNSFGTDEYIKMCRKIGCEPYICTNAGTGTCEEMSDWVEYCNLEKEGQYAKMRIANGNIEPYCVKYWSIGNENYGDWELGAKSADEWGRLVTESAKLMLHVDPCIELSAAALTDIDWNINILKNAGNRLKWISLHKYWDALHSVDDHATYEQCMAYTKDIDEDIRKARGLLTAMGLEKDIKIAFDEWNLRSWHHPNSHTVYQGRTKDEYLTPRDKNDDNSKYTMADTVFTACFLNTCIKNGDIVGMANYAPIVNTRGCIFTHDNGIVLRGTYYVFLMFTKYMGNTVIDLFGEQTECFSPVNKTGEKCNVDIIDTVATLRDDGAVSVSVINKHPHSSKKVSFKIDSAFQYCIHTLNGDSTESYNDIDLQGIILKSSEMINCNDIIDLEIEPHSVNIIEIFRKK